MTPTERLLRWMLAVGIVGGPAGFLVGGVLAPAVHVSGASTLEANAAADPVLNAVHVLAFVMASFLLPVGALGLAQLAYARTPWLATVAGLLGVLGWLPFSALAALDELGRVMAGMPDGGGYAVLLDAFATGPVMSLYLVVYVVFHLVAYVLFGVALGRGGQVPAWSAWALVASSPVTVLAFALPGDVGPAAAAVGNTGLLLLLVGGLPAARAVSSSAGRPAPSAARPAAARPR